MKRILVLGAGFLQSFVIKRARELGYYTIAIDRNPNATGFKDAHDYAVVDIVDQAACLGYAREKQIDGVMTAATDYGVLSASFVAQELGLPGLNYEVARVIKDKFAVRRILFANQVDEISQFYEISSIDELNDISEQVRFPVMDKPCD